MLYSRLPDTSEESHHLETTQLDRKTDQRQDGTLSNCSLLNIPSETLTGITSYLDPPSLFCLARVNTAFYRHVNDDNTWRRAFATRYLGIGPHDDWYDGAKTILLRRSEKSWRNELIARFKLERIWENSRNTSISHIPVPSAISFVHLMTCQVVLSSCLKYGIVGRSLPLSGKVYSGYLNTAADGMGLGGIGNPNLEFTPNASTCSITSKGSSAGIIWGFLDGGVAVVLAGKVMNPRRITTELKRSRLHEGHQGAVSDSSWNADGITAATGGSDGRVKLWLADPLECVWTSEGRVQGVVPDACLKVAVAMGTHRGYIVAAFNSGEILLWTGFETGNRNISGIGVKQILIPCPLREFNQGVNPATVSTVTSLHIDTSDEATVVLVAYRDQPCLYRIRVVNGDRPVEITAFGDPSFGPITSVSPYFAAQPEQGSFVIAGDCLGYISVYDWRSVQNSQDSVRPIRKFEAYEDGAAITALAWNGVTLLTGSSRGTIHVWNGLNFTRLRTFVSQAIRHDRHHLQNEEGNDGSIKQIIIDASKEMFIACASDRVLAWRSGPLPLESTKKYRGRGSGTHTSRKIRSGYNKYLEQLEVKEAIKESRQMVEQENESHKRAFNREREHRAKLEKLGLTEAEALEYVLMLSREEAIETDVPLTSEEAFDIDESFEAESSGHAYEGVASSSFSPLRRSSSTSSGSTTSDWTRNSSTLGSPASYRGTNWVNTSAPVIEASPSSSSISSASSSMSTSSSAAAERAFATPVHLTPSLREVDFPTIASTPSVSPLGSATGASPTRLSPSRGGSEHGISAWDGTTMTRSGSGFNTPSNKRSGKSWSGIVGSSSAGPSRPSASGSGRFRLVGGLKHIPSKSHDAELDEDLRYALELSLAEARSQGEASG